MAGRQAWPARGPGGGLAIRANSDGRESKPSTSSGNVRTRDLRPSSPPVVVGAGPQPTRPRAGAARPRGPRKAAPPTAPAARTPQSLPRFRGREPERQGQTKQHTTPNPPKNATRNGALAATRAARLGSGGKQAQTGAGRRRASQARGKGEGRYSRWPSLLFNLPHPWAPQEEGRGIAGGFFLSRRKGVHTRDLTPRYRRNVAEGRRTAGGSAGPPPSARERRGGRRGREKPKPSPGQPRKTWLNGLAGQAARPPTPLARSGQARHGGKDRAGDARRRRPPHSWPRAALGSGGPRSHPRPLRHPRTPAPDRLSLQLAAQARSQHDQRQAFHPSGRSGSLAGARGDRPPARQPRSLAQARRRHGGKDERGRRAARRRRTQLAKGGARLRRPALPPPPAPPPANTRTRPPLPTVGGAGPQPTRPATGPSIRPAGAGAWRALGGDRPPARQPRSLAQARRRHGGKTERETRGRRRRHTAGQGRRSAPAARAPTPPAPPPANTRTRPLPTVGGAGPQPTRPATGLPSLAAQARSQHDQRQGLPSVRQEREPGGR
ncbi:hypothetical protein C7M84_018117 [Penaeus vannamei]|uniref:Uncharacterized protein n=1 Tax=Penaeus vannamei TaxID=6689 RepID=A0A423SIL2_PENVA|nr:hypothetical protein C7M84_018117 [Penaeus vannamei]